ncbi:hypothetical protein BX600DRAFT_477269 [Xylariales sp. PMI_506]|nr:hypothetical protein BX600DRAFT_477269 [Xylariales sp. PMI_506]
MATSFFWASQSAVTNPGAEAGAAIDALEAEDFSTLQRLATNLVLHYRGRASDVPKGRETEIHTRFAEDMFALLLSRNGGANRGQELSSSSSSSSESPLARERGPADRFVGCCRDSTVLFLSLARQKGIPARARVGFASYFMSGWMVDHVVAEVWDGQRWRLVDPQMAPGRAPAKGVGAVDWCDVTAEQFMTGPRAWLAAREGSVDPAKFVVDPSLKLEELRGWPYLAHNVIHDLVALAKTEMLLWDAWGIQLNHDGGPIPDADAAVIDDLSKVLLDEDVKPEVIQDWASRDGLSIPPKVLRFDPYGGPPVEIDVSKAIRSQ